MAPPALNRNAPSQFQNAGTFERVSYRYYDTVTITNGLATDVVAFSAPATNPLLGNFEGGGAMPAGQMFHLQAIRVFPNPTARWDDVSALLNGGVLTFTKENSKRYAQGPLYMFPAGMGLAAELGTGLAAPAAPANSATSASNGVPVLGNVYKFQTVTLMPQQNFRIAITPGAPVLAASVTVRIILEGILDRNLI